MCFSSRANTLSLKCVYADYDGESQIMKARKNVVLKHRKQTLYTDSLDYDRLYKNAYFFEGGKLVDGKEQLVSDWGEYSTESREAVFYYNVVLKGENRRVTTDTLHYDTRQSIAHVLGPSKIEQGESIINTEDAFFNTQSDQAQLYGRSTIIDGQKTIIGDSVFYDKVTGQCEGYGNVIFIDQENKNSLIGDYLNYNELTGFGFATKNALVKEFSQRDTLYMHADSIKIYTYNIETDSVYRVIHAFNKARAFRTDVQAVSDSLVFNTLDTCLTMYKDPVLWNGPRQLLGEVIKVYMNDSTVREAHVLGQALSIEQTHKPEYHNQISSRDMFAYFVDGAVREAVSVGNVKIIYFTVDDKDSSFIGMNYTETDTMKMYISEERKLERIWMPKQRGVLYPMTQIPAGKSRLPEFAWLDRLRPVSPEDVFVWRGKEESEKLKVVERHAPPTQKLSE